MEEDTIVKIHNKRLNKLCECSYGAFLRNWSNYGWIITKIVPNRIKIEDLKDFDAWKAWKNGNLQLEPLWAEDEVSRLLDTQRGNSYVAVYNKTHDKGLASLASKAPEPGQWKDRK